MKKCSICKINKTLDSYWNNKLSKDGLYAHCKLCHLDLSKKTREKYREKYREISRKSVANWRKNHPEESKERNKKYRLLHGEKYNKNNREKRLIIKKIVIEKYGNKCECCGESDYRFLTLDHKNNDGKEHRKKIKTPDLTRWALKNNFPNTIRLLCYNCNLSREHFGGKDKICPHKLSLNKD